MKSTNRLSHYFSAKPNKSGIGETAAVTMSPYLQMVLSGKTRAISKNDSLPLFNSFERVIKKIKH